MIKKIKLTRGKVVTVDARDYEFLSQWNWLYLNGYAARQIYTGLIRGKVRIIYMHRQIVGTPECLQIDHIDGDRLNNSKANLRFATSQKNSYNKKRPRNNKSSKYKGVCFFRGRWVAQIGYNNINKYLGRFCTQKQAAAAYNKAAIRYHGQFASINAI